MPIRADRNIGLGRFRNSWPQRGMRAAAVVMAHELRDDHLQMPLVDGDQEVEALSTNRSDQPLRKGVGLRRPNRSLEATGAVPPGLTLFMIGANTAELRGTPTVAGFYQFAVRFADSGGAVAVDRFNVWVRAVVESPLTVTTSTPPQGQVGTPYSARIEASGRWPPDSFGVQYLPAGLVLNALTGEISGTPTEAYTTRTFR